MLLSCSQCMEKITEVKHMAVIIKSIANNTARAIQSVTAELVAARTVILQNRVALDYILASQGGTCAAVKKECCTYIPDNEENTS